MVDDAGAQAQWHQADSKSRMPPRAQLRSSLAPKVAKISCPRVLKDPKTKLGDGAKVGKVTMMERLRLKTFATARGLRIESRMTSQAGSNQGHRTLDQGPMFNGIWVHPENPRDEGTN